MYAWSIGLNAVTNFTIRHSLSADAQAINKIANWYIANTAVNFDTEPWSLQKRRDWIETFNTESCPYRLLVGECDGGIIGFCCNTRFRPKAAYQTSTETTVYIANGIESSGRGKLLYETLLNQVKKEAFHRAYAVITLPNPVSIRLHENLGFTLVGTFDEIGCKFDRYHNVAMYQMVLG